MTKDYYKILDIPEYSTQDEIKSAYRKLARKWHPDIAGNTSDVISKFKEINEAYEVLSNIAKKADYDTAKRFYNYGRENASTKKTTENNATRPDFKETSSEKQKDKKQKNENKFNFKWEEFIAKKYRENFYKKEQKKEHEAKRGDDIFTEIEISVYESIAGTVKVINMLQTSVCPKCGGRKFVNGSICHNCSGKGEVTNHKRFSVKIPAGIKSGSKIRLAGEGELGINGGKNGDLYLTVNIAEPKNYKVEGLNILKTLTLEPHEAILGTNVSIPTLTGNVTLTISPNTKCGQKIRLSGCGYTQGNNTGDLILTVEIQIPENLTNDEIELYKKLSKIADCRVNRLS